MINEDYGKILRDFTLTLDKFRKGKKEKVNGSTSDEWSALVATKSNWTIALQ